MSCCTHGDYYCIKSIPFNISGNFSAYFLKICTDFLPDTCLGGLDDFPCKWETSCFITIISVQNQKLICNSLLFSISDSNLARGMGINSENMHRLLSGLMFRGLRRLSMHVCECVFHHNNFGTKNRK